MHLHVQQASNYTMFRYQLILLVFHYLNLTNTSLYPYKSLTLSLQLGHAASSQPCSHIIQANYTTREIGTGA